MPRYDSPMDINIRPVAETDAEDVYKHIGFIPYEELKNGIKEPWDDKKTFRSNILAGG